MNNKLALFSFFSGIGLLDLGFEEEGFEIVFANEYKEAYMKGYEYARSKLNLKNAKIGHFVCSIDEFLTVEKVNFLKAKISELKANGYKVGFIGGPPCPDFSVAGKNKGKDGENGKLSSSYVDLISKVRPDFFVFENVKGLLRTKKHKEFFDTLTEKFNKNKFVVKHELLNAIEFGVAQDRDRVFIIGVNKSSFGEETVRNFLKINLRKYATYPERSAFDDFIWIGRNNNAVVVAPESLTIEHWFKKNQTHKHPNANHHFQPRAAAEKFRTIIEGDVSKKSFKRLHRKRYSPTAAYGNNEVHIHPTEPRRISVAEVMAIQSLPPDYVLPETMSLTDMFKTLGNGVPYLMARSVAKSIKEVLITED